MKRFVLFILSVFTQILLVAQTQFDYMDDDAVAGGADRALNGIIIIDLSHISNILSTNSIVLWLYERLKYFLIEQAKFVKHSL